MTRGGSRAGAGRPKGSTELVVLPREGYRKRVPGLTPYVPRPTARQKLIWRDLWRTPQASRWAQEKWRWPSVAILCRLMARAEAPDASAAIYAEVAKYESRLGLSDAGLRYLGWVIAEDEVAQRRATNAESDLPPLRLQSVPTSPRERTTRP